MAKCSKCPPREKPVIKELPDPRKHCHICGDCMENYIITPYYYPKLTFFAGREYHFCSEKY